jgi:hypothetical protein
MGFPAAGSGPAKDGGFLWVIKIHSVHFLQRESKPVGPMLLYGIFREKVRVTSFTSDRK